jgi:hypothetical protein
MTRETEEYLRSSMERESAAIHSEERLWAAAIRRGKRLRRRRRVTTWFGLGAAATTAVIATGALSERFGHGHDEPAGPSMSEAPSPKSKGQPQGSVLLDTIVLDDGRRVELVADRDGTRPCLQIIGIDQSVRECGRAPSERVPPVDAPISPDSIAQRDPSSPLEIYGATSPDVAGVRVVYRDEGGERRTRPAYMLHAASPTTLDQAGIAEPFGYYLAELPPSTTIADVEAFAVGAADETLGSVDYSMFHDQPLDSFISGPAQR